MRPVDVYKRQYYKITEDERGNSLIGLAEIIIAKHRNGAVGDVRLRFKSEFAKFMNCLLYTSRCV